MIGITTSQNRCEFERKLKCMQEVKRRPIYFFDAIIYSFKNFFQLQM